MAASDSHLDSSTMATMVEETQGIQVSAPAPAAESFSPLHGDLLQAVLCRLSLFDLLPASCVSRSWRRAVTLSLDNPPRVKPWLILRRRASSPSAPPAALAYDPNSCSWICIPSVPLSHASPLRASHGSLLYSLSPSKFSVSWDALNFVWRDVGPPVVWRSDPLVAVVGMHVVVAGGACDFEDEPLAVEVYRVDDPRRRLSCQPMPLQFKNSSSPVWLSVAASNSQMFVLGKDSGAFCSLNMDTMTWGPVSSLSPGPSIFFSVIGFSDGRLIQVGLDGDAMNVFGLRIWEVSPETFERNLLGEMPSDMLERLKKPDSSPLWSIKASVSGDFAYIYDPSDPREIFFCDFSSRNCSWCCFENPVLNEGNLIDNFVFTCSKVEIDDLRPVCR
ncbi:F-box/kelch-repeat protein At1g23390 [Aristolochia californica]|uniref:F-box/kelch-repeat protein At1g23390 n=1 Tax=Aristolochia californica TaxID=171875 RepID=UPI0035D9EDC9